MRTDRQQRDPWAMTLVFRQINVVENTAEILSSNKCGKTTVKVTVTAANMVGLWSRNPGPLRVGVLPEV